MCSVSSGVDAVNSHEVLRGPFGYDSLSSHAISPELHGPCTTVAVMASSLAGVCTDCVLLSFAYAVGVTLLVSWKRCYSF